MCAAASMTAEWRQEYNRRNSMLKNGSYQGAGDVTTRLIREWRHRCCAGCGCGRREPCQARRCCLVVTEHGPKTHSSFAVGQS